MAPSLVQSKSGTATSGTTVTVTLTGATAAGNCLVVYVGAEASTLPSVSGITLGGSAGNFALAKKISENAGGLGNLDCEVWTDQNCAGSQTSVVVTLAATITAAMVYVEEWSGIAASSAVDQTNGAGANSGSFSSGATGTLAQASELVTGAVIGASLGSTSIAGPSSPWSNQSQLTIGNNGLIASHEVVSATTAQTYSGTVSGTSTQFYAAVIVTLKAAASGGGGGKLLMVFP